MDFAQAINALTEQDYFIWDDFLSPSEVDAVVADFAKVHASGAFKIAGTGNQKGLRKINESIRSDETYWLEPAELTPAQMIFWNRFETLKKEINEALFLGLWSLEGHYSKYYPGGHYEAHRDRFHTDDRRTISTVLYFNKDWAAEEGGALRIYRNDETKSTEDILPLAGRLVVFLSEKVLHEVRPPISKPRLSFAGWWKRR